MYAMTDTIRTQIEIDVIRACIQQYQPFAIVRSRSDELVYRIADDEDLDHEAAKIRHVETTMDSLVSELGLAGIPDKVIQNLLQHCILVNKNDLRELTVMGLVNWPQEHGRNEIHERGLIQYLQRRDTVQEDDYVWA